LLDVVPVICFLSILLVRFARALESRRPHGASRNPFAGVELDRGRHSTAVRVRHWYFTLNRVSARQRPSYQDLLDSDLPAVSIIIRCERRARRTAIFDALIDRTTLMTC